MFVPPMIVTIYLLGIAVGVSMGAYYVIPDSILGDCIDYDEFHTGFRSESSYTVIGTFRLSAASGAQSYNQPMDWSGVETNLQQFMEVPSYVIPFSILVSAISF